MSKIIAALALIAAVAGAAFWGWTEYESRTERLIATERLREVSALTGRQMAMSTSDSISFAEYIKRSEQTVDSIEAVLVSLKSQKFTRRQDVVNAVIEFSADAQSAARELLAQARLQLRANITTSRSKEAMAELKLAKTQYSMESALDSAKKASTEDIDALDKAVKAKKPVNDSLSRLYASDYKVKLEVGPDEGLDSASLSALSAIKKL